MIIFSPSSVERCQRTTGIEERSTHQHEAPLQEEEQVHFDTHMADIDMHEEDKSPEQTINEKEAKIRELKDKLSKENFMITFLQQENKQLQVKQLLLSKPKADLEKDGGKGKTMVDVDELEDHEDQVKPRRPRTIGLKRHQEQQTEPSPSLAQEDFDDLIATEIEQDKESWLQKVNFHLEKILEKANMNTNI